MANLVNVHRAASAPAPSPALFGLRWAEDADPRLVGLLAKSPAAAEIDEATGVTVLSADGPIVGANGRASELLGLTWEQFVGRTSLDPRWGMVDDHGMPLPGDHHPSVLARSTGESQPPRLVGMFAPTPTDPWHTAWLRSSAHPLLESGSVLGVVVCSKDASGTPEAAQAANHLTVAYRVLAESISDVLLRSDLTGRHIWVSPSLKAVLGWEPSGWLGRQAREFIHPDDLASVRAAMARSRAAGEPIGAVHMRLRTADGQWKWMSAHGQALLDADGRVIGGVDTMHDIDATVRAREALADSERRFRMLAENSSDLVLHVVQGVINWASPAAEELTGRPPQDILGSDPLLLAHPSDRIIAARLLNADNPPRHSVRFRLVRPSGAALWMDARAKVNCDGPDDCDGLVVSLRNVTREVAADRALAASEAMFRELAENSADTILRTNIEGIVEWVSGAIEGLLGWSTRQALGSPLEQLVHPDDGPELNRLLLAGDGGQVRSTRLRLRMSSGRYTWVAAAVRPIPAALASRPTLIWSLRDAQMEQADRRRLADLAGSDPLTGLPNRNTLLSSLEAALRHKPRLGRRLGVAFVDVDSFKEVNDTSGHEAGDQVLQRIAIAIMASVRTTDLVARLGGDEFVVLLDGLTELDDAHWVVEKIRLNVHAELQQLNLPQTPSISVGLVLAGPGEDAASVLRRADAAMYEAKKAGGNRIVAG